MMWCGSGFFRATCYQGSVQIYIGLEDGIVEFHERKIKHIKSNGVDHSFFFDILVRVGKTAVE